MDDKERDDLGAIIDLKHRFAYRMAELLKRAEWASGGGFGPSADDQEYKDVSCYFCDGRRDEFKTRGGHVIKSGHEPGCELAALLAEWSAS